MILEANLDVSGFVAGFEAMQKKFGRWLREQVDDLEPVGFQVHPNVVASLFILASRCRRRTAKRLRRWQHQKRKQ